MRRWNGWGDDSIVDAIPAAGAATLSRLVGEGTPPPPAALADVVAAIPPGRLPANPSVVIDAETRLRHARGQSLPDWLALRSGHPGAVPDGVAVPADGAEVRDLLAYAEAAGARVIPYGGARAWWAA